MSLLYQLVGIAATAFVVGLSGAMMPGPLLAVTIDESVRRGARAGPLLMVGHAVLEMAVVAAVALGLGSLLASTPVIVVVSTLGGGMMCWMGVDMVRSVPTLSMSAQEHRRSKLHPVAAGIVVSLSNPYWTIWWATIGIGYLVIGLRFGVAGVAAFFGGHIMADVAWYTAVSFGVARGRKWIGDTAYRVLAGGCGIVLVGFGAWFFMTAGREAAAL